MSKNFAIAKVRLDLMSHRCAWRGCRATTPFMEPLPPHWRWLMLWWSAEPVPSFDAVLAMAERDAVLCPLHADMLHNEVLEDIGQRLDETKGSA